MKNALAAMVLLTAANSVRRAPRRSAMARIALVLLVLFPATGCVREPAPSSVAMSDAQTLQMFLPAGDREAGRKTFVNLGCTSCHAVPSDPGLPLPVSAHPGPPIGARVAALDASYLATAIVSPSHQLSPRMEAEGWATLDGMLSPMGDYSQSMTVRQLVDLYAFLRSAT